MIGQLYVLYEHAVGYCIFQVREFEEVGTFIPQVTESINSNRLENIIKLIGFKVFKNAAEALENINAVSEGIVTDTLSSFLQTNLPTGKKVKATLGVSDSKLGTAINEALTVPVTHIGAVPEIIRGIRLHLSHFIKGINEKSLMQAELGLGHAYSRGKVKFNVNRVDNMILQAIAVIDLFDKDINSFTMRIREWYSYHFPELSKIVSNNVHYVSIVNLIQTRNNLTNSPQEYEDKVKEILADDAKVEEIMAAARTSIGMDISDLDLLNIQAFAKRISKLLIFRQNMGQYLSSKVDVIAPNIGALLGDNVAARLISKAGSLTNLAKIPASTIQLLGAEKALFRALKNKSATPKYGLLFHAPQVMKTEMKDKGKIARCLANKCALASRIDCFSDETSSVFGLKMKEELEERMLFLKGGELPRPNEEVMQEAQDQHRQLLKERNKRQKAERKARKAAKKAEDAVDQENGVVENGEEPMETNQVVEKKKKKNKKQQVELEEQEFDNVECEEQELEQVKKTPKKNKKVKSEEKGEEVIHEEEKPKKKKKNKNNVQEEPAQEEREDEEMPKKKKKGKIVAAVEEEVVEQPKKSKKRKSIELEAEPFLEVKTPKKKKKNKAVAV